MTASLALQYLVIALAVLASAWVVAKKQFPGAVRQLRIALAVPLLRDGQPGWLRRLGRAISPVNHTPVNHTLLNHRVKDGCGGCDHCGPRPHA